MKFQSRVTLQKIPDGPEGVRQTLNLMRVLTRNGKKEFPVRKLALDVVGHNGQKNWIGEIRSLQRWVRDRIRYVKDIRGVETVATPLTTLELNQGDCDDKSVLLASLLESIGHPTRFVAIGFKPGNYEHVLVETRLGSKWIPLETTEPVEVGWYPPGVRARMEVHN